MDFTNQINNESEKPHLQYSRQVPNATRNVLTKIFKFKNSSGDTTDSLPAAMADASSNSDLSAAGASDCPSSPRPTHASISDGSEGSDADIEESSRAVSLSPPDSVPDTQGAHVEGSQYPHPGLIFGNHGPPPGLTGANHQAVHQETAENQRPLQNQALGTQGFRRLPPPPGFGTSFGNRRYPSGFRPPVMFEKCFSLASTRIYDNTLHCDRCGGGSDLSWFYRCCHDTDARLFESIRDGNKECFDEIGEMLTRDLKAPERGAATRQDKLSPLKEMGPDQLNSYTSEQLGTVLKQHENAVDTALRDRYGPFVPPAEERPYIVGQAEECRATLCPRCGQGGMGEDLAWLSIDSVLKGDIPATAAVGYGFRAIGGRPVADANIVKNLGLRDLETGQLPEKKPNEEAQKSEASEVRVETGGSETAAVAVSDEENRRPPKAAEGLNLLAMGDWRASPEVDRLDAASIMADKGSESNEDLIDFYADSEKGNTSGNTIRNVAEVKHNENAEGAQNDKPGAE